LGEEAKELERVVWSMIFELALLGDFRVLGESVANVQQGRDKADNVEYPPKHCKKRLHIH
jgi:hypothetical protein